MDLKNNLWQKCKDETAQSNNSVYNNNIMNGGEAF